MSVYLFISTGAALAFLNQPLLSNVCVYVCMYVCMYVCIIHSIDTARSSVLKPFQSYFDQ
jgi:hypothetical protein